MPRSVPGRYATYSSAGVAEVRTVRNYTRYVEG